MRRNDNNARRSGRRQEKRETQHEVDGLCQGTTASGSQDLSKAVKDTMSWGGGGVTESQGCCKLEANTFLKEGTSDGCVAGAPQGRGQR